MGDYNFEATAEGTLAFKHNNGINSGPMEVLKVFGKELQKVLSVKKPTSPNEEVLCCGCITEVMWPEKDPGEIVCVKGFVPPENKGPLKAAIDSHDTKGVIELNMEHFMYDSLGRDFFNCWNTDGKPIQFHLSKTNKSRVLDLPMSGKDLPVELYEFELYLKAADVGVQTINIAYSPTDKKTFEFGQKRKG